MAEEPVGDAIYVGKNTKIVERRANPLSEAADVRAGDPLDEGQSGWQQGFFVSALLPVPVSHIIRNQIQEGGGA